MILQILNELQSNNSRNFKIDLLVGQQDNELLKKVCELALSPMIQFYQRKIPLYTRSEKETNSLEFAVGELKQLSERIVTGNAAINALSNLLSTLDSNDAKVIERIIQKDLKCGVSTSTVNKVWSNLIPEFPCMLCSPFEQKLVDKITFPAIVQKKEDGMRFNAIVKFDRDLKGAVEFRSRNGKEISLLGSLEQEFIDLAYGKNLVFDGELLVLDVNGELCDRQTGNGILNRAVKGTISKEEADRVVSILWDQIPYEDFIVGKCDQPYSYRFKRLEYLVNRFPQDFKIELVETFDVHSLEQVQGIFQNYLADGDEGIILKDLNSLWENKRSKGQIKFKAELDTSLIVTDIQLGTGKYEGLLGAIICESADGKIKVNVGSGFTDAHRKEFIDNSLIGKIVSVKYNAKIQAKNGDWSLFLPIFEYVREDQDSADPFNKIL